MTDSQKSDFHNIGLSAFIDRIRSELEASERLRVTAGKGELFYVENVELELSFTVTESRELKGGFSLKIISADAGNGINAMTVHKAKIILKVGDEALRRRVPGSRPYPGVQDVEPL